MILQGHFKATAQRLLEEKGPLLILHDTTEFSYKRASKEAVGLIGIQAQGKDMLGRIRQLTSCGILMHSSLVVTPQGVPLGLRAVKFWMHKKFKGCNALKRHINPTRVPIDKKESYRWIENLRHSMIDLPQPERYVHIGDRESDIYEFLWEAQALKSHFLIRTCADRFVNNSESTLYETIKTSKVKGEYCIQIPDSKGNLTQVTLKIKFTKLKVLPSVAKRKNYPALFLTALEAREKNCPDHSKPTPFVKTIKRRFLRRVPFLTLG
jgi:hypothetical protein